MNIVRKLLTPYTYLRDKYVDWRVKRLSEKDRFRLIYSTGYWKSSINGSLSGTGSDEDSTINISKSLAIFLRENQVKTMLDLPCGDWNWMSNLNLNGIDYIGADIVDSLVSLNQKKFGSAKCSFRVLDILSDDLPKVDLIFVRDCFVHLEDRQIIKALKNIARSGSKFLATTTYPQCNLNQVPVEIDRWRQLNLKIEPFFLPKEFSLLSDVCESNSVDANKHIGVWKISSLEGLQ
jgi:SAM-dependent methyltransferase